VRIFLLISDNPELVFCLVSSFRKCG
jgi:hypothetical protein